jgi:hypothetical protein
MEQFNIIDIAKSHAVDTVKALAIAQRMNMINTEEDLTSLISSGIETAIEDFIQKTEELKNNEA